MRKQTGETKARVATKDSGARPFFAGRAAPVMTASERELREVSRSSKYMTLLYRTAGQGWQRPELPVPITGL